MKKKLLLINPVGRKSGFLLTKFSKFPPLGLAYVAAATPDNWEIKIIDEHFDLFEFETADLVGMTAFTSNINRAYEIAAIYRAAEIPVVIGGIHASMLPKEAANYVDAVVVGEAESIWQEVIKDFENGVLRQIYQASEVDFANSTLIPRHDLLSSKYIWRSVQTSRGCPFNCHFCSVTKYLGKDCRQRKIPDVIEELKSIDGRYILFVDDNLMGHGPENKERMEDLLETMIQEGVNKKWGMQASINIAEDEKLVKLAAEAGCMFALIGFEAISKEALKAMRKGINLQKGINSYQNLVNIFHKNGIAVLGAFIIGHDNESAQDYINLKEFLINSKIDIIQITTLTPLPGTRFMDQINREKRLVHKQFPDDWHKFRFSYMVHEPYGTTAERIYRGNNYIKNNLYSFPNYQKRLLKSFLTLKNLTNSYAVFRANQSYKKGWMNSHYYSKYPSTLPDHK